MANKDNKTNSKIRKHIFGSTEKSDFILNMTGEGAQKMCAYYSIISVIIIALLAIPAYFTQTIEDYTLKMNDGSEVVHYLFENFIFYSAAAVMIAGFVGFLIFMISCTKKQVSLKDNKSLVTALGVMILSCISCFASENVYTAALGYLCRHEGLITIIGYWGLFCVAMAVTADDKRIKLTDFIVGLGLFQAVVGISQALPATSSLTNNFFEYLFVRPGSETAAAGEIYYDGGYSGISGIYVHARAASGFMTSPYALQAMLAVAFACAFAGAVFDASKKRKIFYGVSAPIIAAAAFLTQVLPAMVGICCGGAIVLAAAAVKAFSKNGAKSVIVTALVIAAVSGAVGGVLFGTGAVKLHDEEIIFTDGFVMRSITHYGRQNTEKGIYTYLADDGMYVAEQNLLLGTGSDNLPYEFSDYGIYTDRFYNEYVDMAATRGVPCLVFYGLFILVSIVKMIKSFKSFISGESWIPAAASAAATAYLVQAFFNTSWTNSAPYLFIMLGLVWSFGASGKTSANK